MGGTGKGAPRRLNSRECITDADYLDYYESQLKRDAEMQDKRVARERYGGYRGARPLTDHNEWGTYKEEGTEALRWFYNAVRTRIAQYARYHLIPPEYHEWVGGRLPALQITVVNPDARDKLEADWREWYEQRQKDIAYAEGFDA